MDTNKHFAQIVKMITETLIIKDTMPKIPLALKTSKGIQTALSGLFIRTYSMGIRANHLTLIQLPMIPTMIWHAYNKKLSVVITLNLIMMFLDSVDGPFARATNSSSKFGHFLDKTIDLLSIIGLSISVGLIFSELMSLSIILIVFTIILYIYNEVAKIEIWGGSRILIPVGIAFDQVLIPMVISLIITILIIIYDIRIILKNEKKGRPSRA